jgi:hypothetical protein
MPTIINRLLKDVREITRQCIRNKMPTQKIIQAGICWHLENIDQKDAWTFRNIAAGTEKKLIKQLYMHKCRKCEAQALLITGERINDCWVTDTTKICWLQAI